MGFFSKELANVVEWNESQPGVIFWKWQNQEIKKGSKLMIRPGQDAIFMWNGKIEGVFTDEGRYDIESDIIPLLSTLKSFKFGFNTPFRAEVMFINTKEMLVKWGTKNAINLQAPGLPGGMPIRAFGTFNCKVADYSIMIDKLAGIKNQYTLEDVKERITASLDQLLMSWIGKEGHDMFNLQADARNIASGIESDLDMDMRTIGIGITDFTIESFSYPEEVRKMQEKAAAQSMVGDVGRYQQMAMANAMENGNHGGSVASDMAGMQMGMMMGQQMVNQMQNQQNTTSQQVQKSGMQPKTGGFKFCPECGSPVEGMKFCPQCGYQLM